MNDNFPNEIEIIKNARSGNEIDFAKLVDFYQNKIFRYIGMKLQSRSKAEDLTQETFFKVWKNLDKFDDNQSFKTWIFTIARNTVYDDFRKRRLKNISLSRAIEWVKNKKTEESIFDENIEKDEELENMMKSVKGLSTEDREIISMRYFSDLKIREISEILKIPQNTVKTKIRRALKKLRLNLEQC